MISRKCHGFSPRMRARSIPRGQFGYKEWIRPWREVVPSRTLSNFDLIIMGFSLRLNVLFLVFSILSLTASAAFTGCQITTCSDNESEIASFARGFAPFCDDCVAAWQAQECNQSRKCLSKTDKEICKRGGGRGVALIFTGKNIFECQSLQSSETWNLRGRPAGSRSEGVKVTLVR